MTDSLLEMVGFNAMHETSVAVTETLVIRASDVKYECPMCRSLGRVAAVDVKRYPNHSCPRCESVSLKDFVLVEPEKSPLDPGECRICGNRASHKPLLGSKETCYTDKT